MLKPVDRNEIAEKLSKRIYALLKKSGVDYGRMDVYVDEKRKFIQISVEFAERRFSDSAEIYIENWAGKNPDVDRIEYEFSDGMYMWKEDVYLRPTSMVTIYFSR